MASLLIILAQCWAAVRTAWRDPLFRLLAALTAVQLFVGTMVFHFIEGWTFLDSFYFSAITMATVGFGDFTPQTAIGKLLTVFYIFMGVGLLVALLTRYADALVQSGREGRDRRRRRRMYRRVKRERRVASTTRTGTARQLPAAHQDELP